MVLTDAQIKGLKPKGRFRYSKADGGGLMLDVTPGGVKSWVLPLPAQRQAGKDGSGPLSRSVT